MKKLLTLSGVILTSALAACQSINTVVVNEGDGYNMVAQERINVYHNVHYNNPGFYPRGSYQIGGYYWMRGYRY